ncbi:hypothetical protein LCGC14_0451540 [marine sediment metagenome]|uniref:Type II secretion system protein GspG C-terminal domain-containing protein n=1 Tax=marine sediment metagenome TaxID=412755 RepID=A0A0F9V4H9_9ZZZZ|nr:type II secretion system protein [Phycisphaerae bacterium]HDZ43184.1 type II secretion system protein [Phycisphaerae bacterium]
MGHFRYKRGFSLTEMLIVVMVLGLLLSIVVPSFLRGAAISRRVRCSANLHALGQAYVVHKTNNRLSGERPFTAIGWVTALQPYLANNLAALKCPEDYNPKLVLPDVKIWCPKGPYNLDVFTAHPYWLEYAAAEINGGPGIWKVNDEVYDQIRPEIAERHNITQSLPKYTPGKNPNNYWLLFEDLRAGADLWSTGDKDYEDIIIRVEERGDRVDIWAYKGATFHQFDLVAPDGTTYVDIGYQGDAEVYSFRGRAQLSYALSLRVNEIALGTDKVLALDYENDVCYAGVSPPGEATAWDQAVAPRHLGKLNVVLASGKVILVDPAEIDPTVAENAQRYWRGLRRPPVGGE